MASDARDPKGSRAQYDAMLRPDGQIIAFLHRDREIPGIFLASSRELATACASVEVRAARNPVTQAFRSHDRRAILKVNECPPIYFLLERGYMKNSLETSVSTVRRLKPGNDKERKREKKREKERKREREKTRACT